jgi:hypothetical protein
MTREVELLIAGDQRGTPKSVGVFDADGLSYARGVGTWTGRGHQRLRELLGNGFMRKNFHLRIDDVRLFQCRIVESGGGDLLGGVRFIYDSISAT